MTKSWMLNFYPKDPEEQVLVWLAVSRPCGKLCITIVPQIQDKQEEEEQETDSKSDF